MSVTFTPRITWKERANQLAYPFEWFGITPPRGLNLDFVRPPKFVNVAEMGKMVQTSGNIAGGLATTEGHVGSDVKISFPDPERQWLALPGADGKPPMHGPVNFKFQGGDVILDLTLGLYVLNTVQPGDDDKSLKIFAIIYEHELLHVLDETDIVKNWLPKRLMSEPDVVKYLVRAEPFNSFGLPYEPVEKVRDDFLASHYLWRFTITDIWKIEINRRARIRDAPAEYKKVSDQIERIRYGSSTR